MPRSLTTHLAPGVGKRLKDARVRAGLSQRQLAFPGCTAAYISRLEADARVPSLQMLVELARRLDLDPGWLATGKASSGTVAEALDAGRRFIGRFNDLWEYEDGRRVTMSFDSETMPRLVAAADDFEKALVRVFPSGLDEMYAGDELRRVRLELAEARRRLDACREALGE